MRRHRLRHQRTRSLVEEHENTLSLADVLPPKGRRKAQRPTVLTMRDERTGDETEIDVRCLLVAHPQRAFGLARTIVRYYLGCPSCHRRCCTLYPAPVGRTVLLRCRFCLGLRYQSQTHGRSDSIAAMEQHGLVRRNRAMVGARRPDEQRVRPGGPRGVGGSIPSPPTISSSRLSLHPGLDLPGECAQNWAQLRQRSLNALVLRGVGMGLYEGQGGSAGLGPRWRVPVRRVGQCLAGMW